LVYWTPDDG